MSAWAACTSSAAVIGGVSPETVLLASLGAGVGLGVAWARSFVPLGRYKMASGYWPCTPSSAVLAVLSLEYGPSTTTLTRPDGKARALKPWARSFAATLAAPEALVKLPTATR